MFRRICQLVMLSLIITSLRGGAQITACEKSSVATNYGEVRLRKLHLVRPDLIPYPIAYDVYC